MTRNRLPHGTMSAVCLLLLFYAGPAAQQTQLTDAQLSAAAVEMPELVKLLELRPGSTVADVGAGFGAWTMEFADAVGPTGRVYATDVGAAQIAALRAAAEAKT